MERLGADAFSKGKLLRSGVWIVAFLAEWCPFCQRFLPEFVALGRESGLSLAIGDVTSDESPLWNEFRIGVVPTLVVFQEGEPVMRVDGVLGSGLPSGSLAKARALALGSNR